ncbi:MAG: hypothetical protein HY049_12145, partial [Acidobacteria bacterium]|nr:hypothetical protein [Acidobacteriota bacterium]
PQSGVTVVCTTWLKVFRFGSLFAALTSMPKTSKWDFGRLPDRSTADAIRLPDWSEAVEATRLLTSPAYHLLGSWHHLAPLPYLGQTLAYIRDDPSLEHV